MPAPSSDRSPARSTVATTASPTARLQTRSASTKPTHLPQFLGMALLAGSLVPIQAATNAHLAQVSQSLPLAALASNGVASLSLAMLLATGRFGGVEVQGLRRAPIWAYAAGLFGMVYVLGTASAIPVLGTTLTIGLLQSSQILTGFLIDHFGWFGLDRRPLTAYRGWALLLVVMAVGLLLLPVRSA